MTAHEQQFAASIRRSVQTTLLRGLGDPRIRGLVSVTDVNVAPDHSQAVISVSVLPEEYGALTMEGLRSATSRVRLELGKALARRGVPRLEWRLDRSLKKQAEVDAALARAAERSVEVEVDAPPDARRTEDGAS